MDQWHGSNWQLLEPADEQTILGINFGTGLLNERIETSGALATVLAVIKSELARPVELGPGRSALPEVHVRLCSDSAELLIRGESVVVATAFRRLPELFATAAVAEGTLPIQVDSTVWPADIVQRTGHNAAALIPLMAYPQDIEEPARNCFALLDPAARRSRSILYTNDPALVGHVYPVRSEGIFETNFAWADGTAVGQSAGEITARYAAGDPLTQLAEGNSPGVVMGNNLPIIASVVLPRSTAGVLAAELLAQQMNRCAQGIMHFNSDTKVSLIGLGTVFCAIFRTGQQPSEVLRRQLIRKFADSMTQIPDSVIGDAVAASSSISERMQRERALFGMEPDQSPGVEQLKSLIMHSARTLHAAVDPEARSSGHGSNFGELIESEAIDSLALPGHAWGRRYKPWAPRGFKGGPFAPIPALTIGSQSLRLSGWKAIAHDGLSAGNAAERKSLLAVLKDEHGNLYLVDDKLHIATIFPGLYFRPKSLRKRIERWVGDTPQLGVVSVLAPSAMQNWAKRKLGTIAVFWLFIAAIGAGIYGLSVWDNFRDPLVARVDITTPVELGNGTTIETTDFRILQPKAPSGAYSAAVQINICGGADTRVPGNRPDAQRRISPEDFEILNDTGQTATRVQTSGDLQDRVLAEDECMAGTVEFTDPSMAYPRLAYKNSVGDDVVWYQQGQVPDWLK